MLESFLINNIKKQVSSHNLNGTTNDEDKEKGMGRRRHASHPLHNFLLVSLSASLSVCLSVCLPVSMCVFLSLRLSVFAFVFNECSFSCLACALNVVFVQ